MSALPSVITPAVPTLDAVGLRIAGASEPSIEQTLESMQCELDAAREELEILRRRDDKLSFYMHRLDEELKLAARLQQDFLPRKLPQVGQVQFHSLFRPAGHVSGDLYDVMRLDESHIGFYMADAVGHGMPAALLTMFLKQALVTKETFAGGYRLLEPSATMSRLNQALVEQNLSHATFATAIYGYINTKTFEVVFSRGGHPNPMLMSRSGELCPMASEGSLLGIFPGEQFSETKFTMTPGERFFIYSDGIEVAFGETETLETARWRSEIEQRADLPTEQIIREFASHFDHFYLDPGQRKDDLTLIVLDVEYPAEIIPAAVKAD